MIFWTYAEYLSVFNLNAGFATMAAGFSLTIHRGPTRLTAGSYTGVCFGRQFGCSTGRAKHWAGWSGKEGRVAHSCWRGTHLGRAWQHSQRHWLWTTQTASGESRGIGSGATQWRRRGACRWTSRLSTRMLYILLFCRQVRYLVFFVDCTICESIYCLTTFCYLLKHYINISLFSRIMEQNVHFSVRSIMFLAQYDPLKSTGGITLSIADLVNSLTSLCNRC